MKQNSTNYISETINQVPWTLICIIFGSSFMHSVPIRSSWLETFQDSFNFCHCSWYFDISNVSLNLSGSSGLFWTLVAWLQFFLFNFSSSTCASSVHNHLNLIFLLLSGFRFASIFFTISLLLYFVGACASSFYRHFTFHDIIVSLAYSFSFSFLSLGILIHLGAQAFLLPRHLHDWFLPFRTSVRLGFTILISLSPCLSVFRLPVVLKRNIPFKMILYEVN